MNLIKFKHILSSPYLYLFIVFSLLRLFIGTIVGVSWVSTSPVDDCLLETYSHFDYHFHFEYAYSLAKYISYSIILAANRILGIPFVYIINIIWILSAFSVFFCTYKISKNKPLSFIMFVIALFLPYSFDYSSTRLYRQQIICPLSIIVFSLLIIVWFRIRASKYKPCLYDYILSTILGIVVSFLYFVKEDGMWLLGCVFFLIMFFIAVSIYEILKMKIKKRLYYLSIIFLIPMLVFSFSSIFYRSVNLKYFGVFETQTRTSGELGKFCNNVYKIKSDNRNIFCWAPWDAIDAAFNASPTLSEYQELKNAIFKTHYGGKNTLETPIRGDYLGWELRSALDGCGLWNSERYVNDIFKKANNEIDLAFKNNELIKDDKIQLVPSAGGYSFDEIKIVLKLSLELIYEHLSLSNYLPGSIGSDISYAPSTDQACETFHIDFYNYNNDVGFRDITNCAIKIYFSISAMLNLVLLIIVFVLLVFLVVYRLINISKKNHLYCKKLYYLLFMMFSFVFFMWAYCFSIMWFSSFLTGTTSPGYQSIFYSSACPAFLLFITMFTIVLCKFVITNFLNYDKVNKRIGVNSLWKYLLQV